MTETFKDIPDFPNYAVSNLGKVLNKKKGRFLTLSVDSHGYVAVTLSNKGKVKRAKVHVLVAQAFIPNPEGHETVNHIDENKTNNEIDNLEWMSHSENARLGNITPVVQIDLQGNVVRYYDSIKDVGIDNIGKVCSGERKTAGGYQWAYAEEGRRLS